MKKIALFIVTIALVILNSCKTNDEVLPAGSFKTTFYNNQTGNPNSNALMLHMQNNNDNSLINLYGTFNLDNTPNKVTTITFQKANNDTTVYYLLNDTTGRLETSYINVGGVNDQWVFKYNYINGNANILILSLYRYDWNNNTSELIYQTQFENNNGTVNALPTYANFKTTDVINWGTSLIVAVGAVEVFALANGGTALVTAGASAVLATAAGPWIVTAAGIYAIITAADFLLNNAGAAVPDDIPYPPNTPVQNPTTGNNNPNPNLVQSNNNPPVISFTASMDQQGTILFSNVSGGVPPYQYSVGYPVNFQPSIAFANNYPEDSYLVAVKDANNIVSARVQPLSPVGIDCSSLNVSAIREGKTITATAAGGTAPYQYYFYNNHAGQSFSQNNTFDLVYNGEYGVIVKDANGCSDTAVYCVDDVTNISLNLSPQDNTPGVPSNAWLYVSYTSTLGLIPEFLQYVSNTNDYTLLQYLVTGSNVSHFTPNLVDYCDGGGYGGISLNSYTITGDSYNRTIKFLLINQDQPLGSASVNIRLYESCTGQNICTNGNEPGLLWSQEYNLTW